MAEVRIDSLGKSIKKGTFVVRQSNKSWIGTEILYVEDFRKNNKIRTIKISVSGMYKGKLSEATVLSSSVLVYELPPEFYDFIKVYLENGRVIKDGQLIPVYP